MVKHISIFFHQKPVSLSFLFFLLAVLGWKVPGLRSSSTKNYIEDRLYGKDDDSDDPDVPPLADVTGVVVNDLPGDPGSHETGD